VNLVIFARRPVAALVSGASHLSGPVYMPSCTHPEVRLPLDHRVLCSDCCKKMYYV